MRELENICYLFFNSYRHGGSGRLPAGLLHAAGKSRGILLHFCNAVNISSFRVGVVVL